MLVDRIKKQKNLTKKQSSLANFIIKNSHKVVYMTLKELSKASNSSEVTILRLCETLGLKNFLGLKQLLQEEQQSLLKKIHFQRDSANVQEAKTPEEALSLVLQDEQNNLNQMINHLDEANLIQTAKNILKAKQVVILAHDASTLFAEYLSYRLSVLRISNHNINLGLNNILKSELAQLHQENFVIVFSFPPYYQPIKKIIDYCETKNVPIMTMTDSHDSPAIPELKRKNSVFLCPTKTRYYYNSQSSIISFISILFSCMSQILGDRFHEIMKEQEEVSNFFIHDLEDGSLL